MEPVIIELRGVEFHNKGAELMLHSILQQIRAKVPNASFVMEKTLSSPREKHLANRIFTKTNFKFFKIPVKYAFYLMPKSIRRKNSYVNEDEIDIVLDGSGFAFGDQWGAWKAGYRLADHIVKWKKQGKKVIMMPQAFGPFTEEKLILKMKTIVDNSDLVFARDRVSFGHLKSLPIKRNEHILLKPDFTNLIKGTLPLSFNSSTCEVAIIPNNKMIETASESDGNAYKSLLIKLVRLIQSQGYKPFFLIHEGKKDLALAEETNRSLEREIPVIREDDPLAVKGIIGASRAVITSRFHGLVSCLSQAVPCLATGWSHKYEMLLADYDYLEALLDVNVEDSLLEERIRYILDDLSRADIIKKLSERAVEQKKDSHKMWEKVFEVINN